MLVLALTGIILLAALSDSRPVLINYKERNENLTLLINYLKNYGYITMAIEEMPNLLDEETLKNGIKMAQKLGGIEENGDPYDLDLQNLIRQKRCGVPDFPRHKNKSSNFTFLGTVWMKKDVSFFIDEYMNRGLDRETSRKYLLAAFDMWSKSGDINFYEADSKDNVDMYITHFNDNNEMDPICQMKWFPGEVGHAYRPGEDRGGNVCLNTGKIMPKEDEKEPNLHGDYFMTVTHEIGHGLGMGHGYSTSEIMYPYNIAKRRENQIFLSQDDIDGIQTLYGPSQRADAIHPENALGPFINTEFAPYTATPTDPMYAPDASDRDPPTACDTDIDAVCVFMNKTYVFKRRWFWRFNFDGELEGAPRKIFTLFKKFVLSETYIDAMVQDVYTSHAHYYFVFIGDHYYKLTGSFYANPVYKNMALSESGIHVPKIDAAFHLPSMNKLFLFAGNQYWRCETFDNDKPRFRVDEGYPKNIKVWDGLKTPLDAAYTDLNGNLYFFKGKIFWKLDDKNLSVLPGYPKIIGRDWLNCGLEGKRKGGGGGSGDTKESWTDCSLDCSPPSYLHVIVLASYLYFSHH